MDSHNEINNFQKKNKGKLEVSNVAEKQKIKDMWIVLPKEEKETYAQKNGQRTRIQCSDTKFVNSWKELGEERCTNLKTNLKDNPFRSLLELDIGVRNNDLILNLVSIFNVSNKSLNINGHDYRVTPEEFTNIMGIKDGQKEIDLKNNPSKELRTLFADNNCSQFIVSNKKVALLLKSNDMNIAMRAYALLSLHHIVCAPEQGILNGNYLNNIDDMSNKRWATHAMETLVQNIASFQKRKGLEQKRLGGCVLFLQFFYMHKASMNPKKDVPLLQYFKKKVVDEFLKEHKKCSKRGKGVEPKTPTMDSSRNKGRLETELIGEGGKDDPVKTRSQENMEKDVIQCNGMTVSKEKKLERLNVAEGETKRAAVAVNDDEIENEGVGTPAEDNNENVKLQAQPQPHEGKVYSSMKKKGGKRRIIGIDSESPPTKGERSAIGLGFGDNFPFMISSPTLWKTIESMEALRKIPQKPHFRALEGVKERLREGAAIGSMVTFSRVVEKTCALRFEDPRSAIDECLETVAELEPHGFQVELIRDRLTQLLLIKDKQVEEELQQRIAHRMEEARMEGNRLDVEINEIDKEIAEMEERRRQLLSNKEKHDSRMGLIKVAGDRLHQHLTEVGLEFHRLAAAPFLPSGIIMND